MHAQGNENSDHWHGNQMKSLSPLLPESLVIFATEQRSSVIFATAVSGEDVEEV